MVISLKYLALKLFLLGALFVQPTVANQTAAEDETPSLPPAPKTKKLYKVVDESGKVHYSDHPSQGAEVLTIPEVPSIAIRTPNIEIKTLEDELEEKRDPNEKYYSVLSFANLTNDGVIRNNGAVATFTATISPALSRGHFLEFYLDGKLIKSRQKELTITAEDVAYGPHSASFSVVSRQGATVQKSETLTFNLLHVVRKRSQVNPNTHNPLLRNAAINPNFFRQNIPTHPKVPSYEASKQAAARSSDN